MKTSLLSCIQFIQTTVTQAPALIISRSLFAPGLALLEPETHIQKTAQTGKPIFMIAL
ncbi:hypothetical protein IQ252_08365 [Tychonema sp. LEGE 07203]|nr:hypothetical protein [Tychonema sp. LEGE 07203]